MTQQRATGSPVSTDSAGGASKSVLVALMLVAFNLRTPLTSLPTLVTDIESTTGLGKVGIGALTTIPILMMGLLAFLVPSLAARFGLIRVVWFAVAVLALASAIRLGGAQPAVLFLSAFLAGAGIAMAGGCVPAIVRQQLPHRIGLVTGLWTMSLMLGAAISASLTVPLEHLLGSWQAALAFWAVPTAVAWVIWTVVERRERVAAPPAARQVTSLSDLPWRSSTAWALTAFLAFNSILYYTTVAWLAPSLEARGLTQAQAGAAFGLTSAVGIIAALVFPPLLQRSQHPRVLLAAVVLATCTSLLGIAFVPLLATAFWMVLFGVANTAWFTMGQALIGMLSTDGGHAARLTAMVYAGMYLMAATGPVTAGALLQATGSWASAFAILAGMSLLGLGAVRWLHPSGRGTGRPSV